MLSTHVRQLARIGFEERLKISELSNTYKKNDNSYDITKLCKRCSKIEKCEKYLLLVELEFSGLIVNNVDCNEYEDKC